MNLPNGRKTSTLAARVVDVVHSGVQLLYGSIALRTLIKQNTANFYTTEHTSLQLSILHW